MPTIPAAYATCLHSLADPHWPPSYPSLPTPNPLAALLQHYNLERTFRESTFPIFELTPYDETDEESYDVRVGVSFSVRGGGMKRHGSSTVSFQGNELDDHDDEEELVKRRSAEWQRESSEDRTNQTGGGTPWLPPGGLRPGNRVEAKCAGWQQYYGGVVALNNGNGTYCVYFDDGEKRYRVKASQIKGRVQTPAQKATTLSLPQRPTRRHPIGRPIEHTTVGSPADVRAEKAARKAGKALAQFVHECTSGIPDHIAEWARATPGTVGAKSKGLNVRTATGSIFSLAGKLEKPEKMTKKEKREKKGKKMFTLSYSSSRGALLVPLVEGVLPALSEALHGQKTKMQLLETPRKGFNATWIITTKKDPPVVHSNLSDLSDPDALRPVETTTATNEHNEGTGAGAGTGTGAGARTVVVDAEKRRNASFWHKALSCFGGGSRTGSRRGEVVAKKKKKGSRRGSRRVQPLNQCRSSVWSSGDIIDSIGGTTLSKPVVTPPPPLKVSTASPRPSPRPSPPRLSRLVRQLTGPLSRLAVTCLEKTLSSLAVDVAKAENRNQQATLLMRAVPAKLVAAEWFEARVALVGSTAAGQPEVVRVEGQLESAEKFWSCSAGNATDYLKSVPVLRATRFVSHAWIQPDNWVEVMGAGCSYGDIKATELAIASRDIAELNEPGSGDDWGTSVNYWIDKTCIPQGGNPLTPTCVGLIENFLHRTDGMIVLLSWQYFERLWCVYEWAAFLVCHEPTKVSE